MTLSISKIDERIDALKKQKAELLQAKRKEKEKTVLKLAEKHGLFGLNIQQIEFLFNTIKPINPQKTELGNETGTS